VFFFLKPIKWAIKLFSLVVLAAIIYTVVCAVGVVRAETPPGPPSAARAIVVTGSSTSNGAPSSDLLARLNAALTLFRSHNAPLLVVAGPATASGSVPQAGASWLEGQGVASSAITEVRTSNPTEYVNVAKAIGAGSQVIVVTDAVDARWALDAAGAVGLHASASVVPGSKKLFVDNLGSLIAQASGIAAGRVVGYDHALWAAT
jgi:uncharacterized SAM-binding protein YcdF (DUF218 family)